jgi:hypothetical protein
MGSDMFATTPGSVQELLGQVVGLILALPSKRKSKFYFLLGAIHFSFPTFSLITDKDSCKPDQGRPRNLIMRFWL